MTTRPKSKAKGILTGEHGAEFPFFRLSGTYREMGEQYGRAARAEIQKEAEGAIASKALKASMRISDIQRLLAMYQGDYRRYAPHLLDEIEGVAKGAGITAEESLFLRCQWDISPAALAADGCTSFAVSPKRSATGKLIAGQNKDIATLRIHRVVILALHPRGGAPASLNYAYYGMCEGPGFNSHGLARFENSLFLDIPGRRTIPSHLLKRLFTESASIDECVEWVKRICAEGRLGFAGSMTFGERSGRVVALEMMPGEFRLVEGREGLIAHANDPLHPDFKPHDLTPTQKNWACSRRRTARLDALLRAGKPLDVPYLRRCLADHDGRPRSICRHTRPATTIASLVCVPKDGVLWVSRGNPCRNPHVAYHLNTKD